MNTDSLIRQIQSINPTAREQDLVAFDSDSLTRYLDRLLRMAEPRGLTSRWSRDSRDPAITKFVPSGA